MSITYENNLDMKGALGYHHIGFYDKNKQEDLIKYDDYVNNNIECIKGLCLDVDHSMFGTSLAENKSGFIYKKEGKNIAKVILEPDTICGTTEDGIFYKKAKLTIYDIRNPRKELVFARITGIAGDDLRYATYKPIRLPELYTTWVINNIKMMEQQKDLPLDEMEIEGKKEQILHHLCPLRGNTGDLLTFNKEEKKIKRYTYVILPPSGEPSWQLANTVNISCCLGLDEENNYRTYSVIDYDESKQELCWFNVDRKKRLLPDWGLLHEYMRGHAKIKIPLNFLKNLPPSNSPDCTVFRISNNFSIARLHEDVIWDGRKCEYGLGRNDEYHHRKFGYIDGENVIFEDCNIETLQNDGIYGSIINDEFKIFAKGMYISDGWKEIKTERRERQNYFTKLPEYYWYAEYDTGVKIKDKNTGEEYKVFYVDEGLGCHFCFRDHNNKDIQIKNQYNDNIKKISSDCLFGVYQRLRKKILGLMVTESLDRGYLYAYPPFSSHNDTNKFRVGFSAHYADQNPYDNVGFFNDRLVEFLNEEFSDFEASKIPIEKKIDNPEKKKTKEKRKKIKENDNEDKSDDDNSNQDKDNNNNEKGTRNNNTDPRRNETQERQNGNEKNGQPADLRYDNNAGFANQVNNNTLPPIEMPIISSIQSPIIEQVAPFESDDLTKKNNISTNTNSLVLHSLSSSLQNRPKSSFKGPFHFNDEANYNSSIKSNVKSNAQIGIGTANNIKNSQNSPQNTNTQNPKTKAQVNQQGGKKQPQEESSYAITIFAFVGALAGTIVAIVMRDKKIAVIVGSAVAVCSALVSIISGISTYTANSKIDENRKMNNSVNSTLGSSNSVKQFSH